MDMIFSILGLAGGILCAIGDILFDLKGNHQLFAESVEGELLLSDPELTKEKISEYLADLDLTEFAEDHPMALSGGQKQRVAVGAACAAKKKYLYLDEPTSGLDYIQMKNMSKAIQKMRKNIAYALIVTHDPEFIPAGNEPSSRAGADIWRLPRGSNTPQLCCVTNLMPRQLAAGYLTLECCDYVIELDKGSVKRSYPLDDNGQKMLSDFFSID